MKTRLPTLANFLLVISSVLTVFPASGCDIKIQPCLPDVASMVFKYVGGGCDDQEQNDNVVFCQDYAPLPQDHPVFIRATDGEGTVLFEGEVSLEEEFSVAAANDGETLPPEVTLDIFEFIPGGSDPVDASILHSLRFHHSCSQNLVPGSRAGILQLIGFYPSELGVVDCFINSDKSFVIHNQGDSSVTITELLVDNGHPPLQDMFSSIPESKREMLPGGEIVVFLPDDNEALCQDGCMASVSASNSNTGEACSSSASFCEG